MKVEIIEIDCVGIELNRFEMIATKKDGKVSSRVFITLDDNIIGYFKVYEDGDIELIKD